MVAEGLDSLGIINVKEGNFYIRTTFNVLACPKNYYLDGPWNF